jgi:hypothetical protein
MLLEKTGEEPFPITKIIDFSLSGFPDSPDDFPSEAGLWAQLAPLEEVIGPISGKLESVAVQYAAFLAKFDAQAEDGKLNNAKCVGFATESILEVRAAASAREGVDRASAASLLRPPCRRVSEIAPNPHDFTPPARRHPTFPRHFVSSDAACYPHPSFLPPPSSSDPTSRPMT